MRLAKDTVRSIYQEAVNEIDEAKSKELGKHALRSQSEARLRAMVHGHDPETLDTAVGKPKIFFELE